MLCQCISKSIESIFAGKENARRVMRTDVYLKDSELQISNEFTTWYLRTLYSTLVYGMVRSYRFDAWLPISRSLIWNILIRNCQNTHLGSLLCLFAFLFPVCTELSLVFNLASIGFAFVNDVPWTVSQNIGGHNLLMYAVFVFPCRKN